MERLLSHVFVCGIATAVLEDGVGHATEIACQARFRGVGNARPRSSPLGHSGPDLLGH